MFLLWPKKSFVKDGKHEGGQRVNNGKRMMQLFALDPNNKERWLKPWESYTADVTCPHCKKATPVEVNLQQGVMPTDKKEDLARCNFDAAEQERLIVATLQWWAELPNK
jgi:hypothetical protein